MRLTLLALMAALSLVAKAAEAATAQSKPTRNADVPRVAKKVAIQAGRVVVGTAIGGTAGKVVAGSPVGAAIGILLTPSDVGCGEGETCAQLSIVKEPDQSTALGPRSNDPLFYLEFRARIGTAMGGSPGHVYVVAGRENTKGKRTIEDAGGLYPMRGLKDMFGGQGSIEIKAADLRYDNSFRVYITKEQYSVVHMMLKQSGDKSYNLFNPVENCVGFARDIAKAVALNPPKSCDNLTRPWVYVEELRRSNKADTPLKNSRIRRAEAHAALEPIRRQELMVYRRDPNPPPKDAPGNTSMSMGDPIPAVSGLFPQGLPAGGLGAQGGGRGRASGSGSVWTLFSTTPEEATR
jgi:hypothetical protein